MQLALLQHAAHYTRYLKCVWCCCGMSYISISCYAYGEYREYREYRE